MASQFYIEAHPTDRVVTVGAKVTYSLMVSNSGSGPTPQLEAHQVRWREHNDPSVTGIFTPSTVQGPTGLKWPNAEWTIPGNHKIVAEVHRNGKIEYYTYAQPVIPIQEELNKGPQLPFHPLDPAAALDTTKRSIKIWEAINANDKFKPDTAKAKKAFEKKLEQTKEYVEKLEERLHSTRHFKRHPIEAEYFNAETQERSRLNVFISRVTHDRYVIVDWTNAAVRGMTGEYEAYADSPKDAVVRAINDWNEDNRYPDGGITFAVPAVLGQDGYAGTFETDGSSKWDSISSFFTYVGIGAAVVAGVVTAVAPVPGSRIASAAIWTSLFSSTAAAVINIGTRVDEGFSSWSANAFDVLSIVGNLFGATGVLWSRGATIISTQGNRVVKFALIGSITTDGVQGVMIAVDTADQIESIQNDKSLTPHEKTQRIAELLASASANAALTYINLKSTKTDLANLNKKGQGIGSQSPKETLDDLKNPNAEIDLRPQKKAEGKADGDSHTTKVNVDEETQTPQTGGHRINPNKKVPFEETLRAECKARADHLIKTKTNGDLNKDLIATSRAGVEEFDIRTGDYENLGGRDQFKKGKEIPGLKRSGEGTFTIPDTHIETYIAKVKKLYNKKGNPLHPKTEELIREHIARRGSTPFSDMFGQPGLHAEVQSLNEVFRKLEAKGVDLDTYDFSKIKVATYKLQKDASGGRGNKFKACYNCRNIIREPIDIITGRTTNEG